MDLSTLTIKRASEGLRKKDFSALELAQSSLAAIGAKNKDFNAFLGVYGDVEDQARAAQKLIDEGTGGKLAGIPIALKDNILAKGRPSQAASKILDGYIAAYDATATERLKSQGAVLVGRTNMDEFAMGSSTENSAFGVTKNPHDLSRVAGGSSGGSAVSVAAGMSLGALGSDTGGSIRQPAALCGIVGMKPTYGRVSRYGLMSMGSSLDQIGPFGKTVSDAEIIYDAIKGKDRMDSTTITDDTYGVNGQKKSIGIPKGIMDIGGIDADVKKNFEDSIKKLEELGYKAMEVDLPNIAYSLAVYYIIMPAEVSSNLARYDGVKYGFHADGANLVDDYFATRGEGFGPEARRRILLGTYVLSSGYYDAYYAKATAVRRLVAADLAAAFQKVDFIATPTTPSPAFKIGEKSNDPVAMYLEDIFTVTANIAGVPAISIPSGSVVREGKSLPLGLQLQAPHGAERSLFSAGKEFAGE